MQGAGGGEAWREGGSCGPYVMRCLLGFCSRLSHAHQGGFATHKQLAQPLHNLLPSLDKSQP